MRLESLIRAVVKTVVDVVQSLRDSLSQVGKSKELLLAVVALDSHTVALLNVLGADLDAQRRTLELSISELEARRVVLAVIASDADVGLAEIGLDALAGVVDLIADLIGGVLRETNSDDNDLGLGDARGQHKTLVVGVDHDHDTNGPGGVAPRVLPAKQLLLVALGVLNRDVEHLAEVLAQAVRRGTLDTAARAGDVALTAERVERTGKLLGLRLHTLNGGHGKQIRVDVVVVLGDLVDLLLGALAREVGGVALLPQELTRAKEGLRVFELPAHDRVPLVQSQGQVTVALDPLCVVRVHDGLRSRADGHGLLELRAAGAGDPGNLGSKALDVVLLLLEHAGAHEHREVGVLHANLLDLGVEKLLDLFPHVVGGRAQDVAARHVVVVEQLGLSHDLLVPLRELGLLIGGDTDLHLALLGLRLRLLRLLRLLGGLLLGGLLVDFQSLRLVFQRHKWGVKCLPRLSLTLDYAAQGWVSSWKGSSDEEAYSGT